MASCSEQCKTLDENGVGKCSVPMWMGGMPAGFCGEPAYGERPPCKEFWSPVQQRNIRVDGRYSGYVPYLACPAHGGPKEKTDG